MIRNDQVLALALQFFERNDVEGCIGLLARLPDSEPVRTLRASAAYQGGKVAISLGHYGHAKELFAVAASATSSTVVYSLCQERNRLVNEIRAGKTRPAQTFSGLWKSAKIGRPSELRSDQFAPTIWYTACAAAYRSAYSPRARDPLSELVRRIKNGVAEAVVDPLADVLTDFVFSATPIISKIDFIIPVPGDSTRVSRRGYSIPLLLARKVAQHCAVPLHDELLSTTGSAPDLRHIPRWYRAQAISDAFKVARKEEWLEGKSVLIIDDVITSGATINEVSSVLLSHGAAEVAALALAHSES